MNYAELLQLTQDYLSETETSFVTNIPTFVRQAEERINRSVWIPNLRKQATNTLTASNRFLTAPTDYLAVYSLAVLDGTSNYNFLLNKDVNFIREAYDQTTTEAIPEYYGLWDHNTFILGPTPDTTYTVQLNYYFDPESIVTASTSWLGDNAESVLLYGTLVEAYTYIKGEPELMQLYEARYKEALANLLQLGEALNRRDAYRSGQERLPVQNPS